MVSGFRVLGLWVSASKVWGSRFGWLTQERKFLTRTKNKGCVDFCSFLLMATITYGFRILVTLNPKPEKCI